MRIGLLRHHPVRFPLKGWIRGGEIGEMMRGYDLADIEVIDMPDQTADWDECHTSTLPRAVRTAALVYRKPSQAHPELNEISAHNLQLAWLRLPLWVWLPVLRLVWFFNLGRNLEKRRDTVARLNRLLNSILEGRQPGHRVLIVSHGGVMMTMAAILRKRGFTGERLGYPAHGKVYHYENIS